MILEHVLNKYIRRPVSGRGGEGVKTCSFFDSSYESPPKGRGRGGLLSRVQRILKLQIVHAFLDSNGAPKTTKLSDFVFSRNICSIRAKIFGQLGLKNLTPPS